MSESQKGLVKHILTRMVANVIAELTERYADASEEVKLQYIATSAMSQIVELLRNYELQLVQEALRQWMVELEALDFLFKLNRSFRSRLIRYLGILYAMMRYGTAHVDNAIRIGETISRK